MDSYGAREAEDLRAMMGCRGRLETLLADAGCEGEWANQVRRKDLNIRTIIPARIGRATGNAPSSHYRRLMCQRLHLTRHG